MRGKAILKILLDSHTFVWFVSGDRRCSGAARETIEASDCCSHVSAATAWELATKHRLGKWPAAGVLLDVFAETLDRNGFVPLPVTLEHGLLAGALPGLHKDPFDRMLAAQAMLETMILVTADPAFEGLGADTLW